MAKESPPTPIPASHNRNAHKYFFALTRGEVLDLRLSCPMRHIPATTGNSTQGDAGMPDTLPSSAVPPRTVRRGYDYTQHSVSRPMQPHPGDRIDADLDALIEAVNAFSAAQQAPSTVPYERIDPAVIARLRDEITPNLSNEIAQAVAAAGTALAEAARALAAASLAATHAAAASAAQLRAEQASSTTQANLLDSEKAAVGALDSELEAQNAANDAELSANRAHLDEELAGAWAEFLEGNEPIPAMYFAHTAITGEHWSSRWWAIKAAGAFGAMSELYLGVHPFPPTSTATGDPIPLGAIYYNSTLSQVFVWDGAQWQPFWAPSKAYTFSLTYRATAGQTVFPLTTPDLGGEIWAMTPGDPEIIETWANGVRLLATLEWTVDNSTSTVTLAEPVLAGTMMLFDILVSPNRLAPGRVSTLLLLDFDIDPVTGNPGLIDGTRTTFYLARATDRALIPVSQDTDVQILLDGVVQKPGVDYSVLDDTITFSEPPLVGAAAWGILFAPQIVETVAAGSRATAVRYASESPRA